MKGYSSQLAIHSNASLNMERVRKGFCYLAIGVLPLFPDALFAFLGSTPLSGEGGLTSKSGSVEKEERKTTLPECILSTPYKQHQLDYSPISL